MRDDFDVNDIILNNENPSNTNVKKILTAIAILVVLFLIVLIIMKFINQGNIDTSNELVMPSEEQVFNKTNDQLTITQDSAQQPESASVTIKEISKPEPAKPESQPEIKKVEESEQKLIEIIKTKDPVKPVEPIKESTKKPAQEVAKPVEPAKPVETVKPAEPTKAQDIKKPAQETAKPVTKEIAKPKEVIKSGKLPEKELAELVSAKPTTAKVGNISNTATTIKAGSYVQVFAVGTFDKNHNLATKLVKKGYNVTPYKTNVSGKDITKVLVGPYSGTELQNALKDIRENIEKQAFVFKVQ